MAVQINRKNVLSYLGISQADERTTSLIDKLEKELLSLCAVKESVKIFDAKKVGGYYALDGTGIILDSSDISKLFTEADKIALFAISLGIEVDQKILYYSKIDASKMVIFDALASSYIEQLCEELNDKINNLMEYKYHTVRFSPGYGDLNIDKQKLIIETLGGYKKLGITVSESYMMLPQKSITALVGYSDHKQKSDYECANCVLPTCDINCLKRKNKNVK